MTGCGRSRPRWLRDRDDRCVMGIIPPRSSHRAGFAALRSPPPASTRCDARQDDASLPFEGVPETWFVDDAFCSCVESRRQLLQRLLPPIWDESPAHRDKLGRAGTGRTVPRYDRKPRMTIRSGSAEFGWLRQLGLSSPPESLLAPGIVDPRSSRAARSTKASSACISASIAFSRRRL